MKKVICLLSFLIFLCFISSNVVAKDRHFVLFVMDGVDLSEIKNSSTPNLDKLIKKGAIALTNTRTSGALEPKDAYLTIGAGDRARAGVSAYLNFNLNEKYKGISISDLYNRRIKKLDNRAMVINIELSRIISTNQSSNYDAKVGALADALYQSNSSIAVLGNADIWQQSRRHIGMIAINKYGLIFEGDVGYKMALRSDQHPSGYITNQDYLLKKFNKLLPKNDLIIIESGDTSRMEAVKSSLLADKFKVEKENSITRVDKLLGKIAAKLDFTEDYLFFVVPTTSKSGRLRGQKLTLSILVGPKIAGLLKSNTTKRQGIITNLDIAPTIYNYLGGREKEFTGSVVEAIPSSKSLDYLISLDKQIQKTFSWRPILIKGFILLQIITLFLVGSIILYKDLPRILKVISNYLLISLLWIPALFLVSRIYIGFNLILVIIGILVTSFLLTYYLLKVSNNELIPILVVSLVNFILLIIDVWTKTKLMKLSVLGYSPVIGARYYGIGNEFMGIIIGAGLISLTIIKEFTDRISNKLLVVLFIFLILTVGYPQLGANFGGLITATVVCSVVYFYLQGYNLNMRLILKLISILILIIISVVLIDTVVNTNNQTHLGRSLSAIKRGGFSAILTIIYRKFSMNLKLLRWTIWTRVVLSFVIILIILFKRPRGVIKAIVETYPNLSAALRGLVLGSIVTMIVNDSGIVAAATLLLFPIFSLLYLVLKRIRLN
ncbi:hypothetical protein [Orenia marismortui]|uniref:Alkaline phosphatase n=1 Tax=Orenia marismortui TaxID=46469 RepID=A0A4R8GWZ5_9FIRM|nr:hypothetical protein [Orenia marismortui]TDX46783.1 hypothetical protein C7959_13615 [Orenia marismortui]